MKYLTADYIFPVTSPPIKNGLILMEEDGTIVSVSENPLPEFKSALQTFEGVIAPGFINAHCHLELSYLKGHIIPGTGLAGFIKEIISIRNNFDTEFILKAIAEAESEMADNGIVAVADISNDSFSFPVKAGSKIYFHTLLEVFDIEKDRAEEAFSRSVELAGELKITAPYNSSHSIVPHAPYTVTPTLFNLIKNESSGNHSIQSIHNQECEAEALLFKNKTGVIFEILNKSGAAMQQFEPTGKNSLQSFLLLMNPDVKTLLVHNTYTSTDDITWAHRHHQNLYWCFCPNANIYIENHLPHFDNFIAANARCCIGTDSYASNRTLNLLDELKTIHRYQPGISLSTLLQWATINGAEYLGIENKYGSIDPGKKPGLNLLTNIDMVNLQLTPNSKVTKIC